MAGVEEMQRAGWQVWKLVRETDRRFFAEFEEATVPSYVACTVGGRYSRSRALQHSQGQHLSAGTQISSRYGCHDPHKRLPSEPLAP